MNLAELKQVADDQIHNIECIVKAYGKEEKTQKGNPKQGLLLQSDSSEDWFSFLPQKSERLLGFGDKGKTYTFEIWSNQYGGFCKMAQAQPQQAPSRPPQSHIPQNKGNPPADNKPDWDAIAEGKVRHGLVCAGIKSGQITLSNKRIIADLEYWKNYITTGRAPLPPERDNASDF